MHVEGTARSEVDDAPLATAIEKFCELIQIQTIFLSLSKPDIAGFAMKTEVENRMCV